MGSQRELRRRSAAGLALALLASGAPAQSGSGAAGHFLRGLDLDGDGWVSRAEWNGSGVTFLALDVDRDGWLTAGELGRTARPAADARAAPEPDRLLVATGALPRERPEVFERRCLACHSDDRIERAAKSAQGWVDTVARMRAKEEASISEKEARAIVAWLQEQRARTANALASWGTTTPAADWTWLLGGSDLHRFDRDRDLRLDAGELSRLVHARADVDGDGELSPGEFARIPLAVDRKALFAKLDRDRSGGVSARELGLPQPLLQLFDQNGDGKLAREEAPRSRPFGGPHPLLLVREAKRALELLDRDRDGRLSTTELARFTRTRQRYDADNDGHLDALELETAVTGARVEGALAGFDEFLARYDLDGDGSVAPREFPGRDAVFRRLDADGDGRITQRDAPEGYPRPDDSSEAQRWRDRNG